MCSFKLDWFLQIFEQISHRAGGAPLCWSFMWRDIVFLWMNLKHTTHCSLFPSEDIKYWGCSNVRQMAKVLFAENVRGTVTLFDHHLEWRWLKDTMSLSQVILHTSFVLEKSTTRFYCASHRRAPLMLVLNVSLYRALMNRLHAVRTLLMGCREA